ncbi:MAG: uroporphyrinogen-III C-methyltransferase [Lachnospiraceae bacterium]|jgi:uroporphyrin-III C-methyltransferase/precorrin-2 dehydrogenase/sirohydrochlorin ferrochelatase|nr:uroporphyrinogen-III C-methyltransferase [Lachnospiraceae bacterium]
MGYFPFFVDIAEQRGLVVGGGRVALHKLQKLLPYGSVLTVVAPAISEELGQFALENDIGVIHRGVEPGDLEGRHFVIAASDDRDVNAEIGRLCREKGILVNVVDDKTACSFVFPSLVKAGKLSIGISTAGASPAVAAAIRGQIASQIPADMEEILDYLDRLRPLAREHIADGARRAAFLRDMAELCMDAGAVFDEQETMRRIAAYTQDTQQEFERSAEGVLLVGAGCGSYDLITLRGLRAIRRARVLVYDDLIDRRLLEYASESCERIYVGKRSGRHSMPQEEINGLLVQKAQEGGLVVRLKGGDPYVFGRGMEELRALREAGIRADYVPGITSCIAIPALAGIPVTHREVSRSFHVITGHTAGGGLAQDIDFPALARLEGTLVFLMGLGHLAQIAEALMRAGKEASTPAAVVHGSFDSAVTTVRGQLSDIAARADAAQIQPPAVIVVGNVVDIPS